MEFGIASATEWQLERRIGKNRKRRLLEKSFDTIVQQISEKAELHDYGCKEIRRFPGLKRVWFKLILEPPIVDLFHNGAGGYRAQFYLDIRQGVKANRCVIESLLAPLESLCAARPKEGCSWRFIQASLCHHDAKVWIHEGAWLTDNRSADQNLVIDRWEQNARKITLQHRFEPSWARLTPKSESQLELKGGCVDETFVPVDVQLKPSRSLELHDHGYT